jgi:pectate lyase
MASVISAEPQIALPAFPGAEGFGANSLGGRGGDVYHVTNLNSSGPGTLRDGIASALGPRTIVFDVSGTIALNSPLIIDKPYLTIAGQTAPGEGITLRNYVTAIMRTHDITIRYVRFRVGDTVVGEHDSLLIYDSQNVMIDHVSASWGIDETIDTGLSKNVTIQWSMITEGLHVSHHDKGPHSMGSIHYGSVVSLHHNLFAHNNQRSPLVRQQADVVNNVVYNWGSHATIAGWSDPTVDPYGPTQINLQGNYYVAGPSTTAPTLAYLGHPFSEVWASDNLLDSNRNGVRDPKPITSYPWASTVVGTRFAFPQVRVDDARVAYDRVLAGAGASRVRDTIDTRIIRDVVNETGRIINSQYEVGGWPTLQSTPAPPDGDRDGMPDAWELSHALNPANAADRNFDPNGNGFTNLEEYLEFATQGTLNPPTVLFEDVQLQPPLATVLLAELVDSIGQMELPRSVLRGLNTNLSKALAQLESGADTGRTVSYLEATRTMAMRARGGNPADVNKLVSSLDQIIDLLT